MNKSVDFIFNRSIVIGVVRNRNKEKIEVSNMDETDFEDFKDLDEVIVSKEFKQLYNKLPESDSEEIEEINDRYSIKHEMALEDVFSFFG